MKQRDTRSLAAVCCYFNPARFHSRRMNYLRFREAAAQANVHLVTVELAFGDAPFELPPEATLLQLRTESVLWHKERLLNVAIARLMEDCYEGIAWLDADIIFQDRHWPHRTLDVLQTSAVCQMYSSVVREQPCGQRSVERPSLLRCVLDGRGVDSRIGAAGIAWAARTEVLRQLILYDACIAGAGDAAILMGCLHLSQPWWREVLNQQLFFRFLTPEAKSHYLWWAEKAGSIVGGRVGYVNQQVLTFYHGRVKDRRYRDRHLLLADFDPHADIGLDEHQCWKWTSDKPRLHAALRDYFRSRREDS